MSAKKPGRADINRTRPGSNTGASLPEATDNPGSSIYGDHAEAYVDAKLRPFPIRGKDGLPKGVTGNDGTVTDEKIAGWMKTRPGQNIAIRAEGWMSIDVDVYDGKRGDLTLAKAVEKFGPLPPTWSSTARGKKTPSRQYFFSIAEGHPHLVGDLGKLRLGPDVEIVQFHHRYAMVWPSVHPGTGKTYTWYTSDGKVSDHIPHLDDLPDLPLSWLIGLQAAPDAELDHDTETLAWRELVESFPKGTACNKAETYRRKIEDEERRKGHIGQPEALPLSLEGLMLGLEGHVGIGECLQLLEDLYGAYLDKTRSRGRAELERLFSDRAELAQKKFAGQEAAGVVDKCTCTPVETMKKPDGEAVKPEKPVKPEPEADAEVEADPLEDRITYEVGRLQVRQEAERRVREAYVARDVSTRGDVYIDAAEVLGDDFEPSVPDLGMRREDGWQVLYKGKVNVIVGDPETGKSLFAAAQAVDVLRDGGSVLWLDMDHNTAQATLGRLMVFGARRDWLLDRSRFRLAEPEDAADVDQIVAEAAGWRPSFAVVDSLGELIPMYGADSNSADDYTRVHRRVLTALANTGAGVLAIDHLSKGGVARNYGGTGTLAKKRAVDGLMVRASILEPFAPGRIGAAALFIVKDRHGGVRKLVNTGGDEPLAGVFNLDSSGPVSSWRLFTGRSESDKIDADLSDLLELDPAPVSERDVKERLGWGSTRSTRALRAYREMTPGGHSGGQVFDHCSPTGGRGGGREPPRFRGSRGRRGAVRGTTRGTGPALPLCPPPLKEGAGGGPRSHALKEDKK